MKSEEAKPLLVAAQYAVEWCRGKLAMRAGAGGFSKDFEHGEAERTALHVAHSIAVCDVERLQAIVKG
jgi:hypothetical protein